MITLFTDEEVILKSDSDIVVLTTHRICKEEKEFGARYNQSIMLEHVTSCENRFVAEVWLLILAGLFLFGGLITMSQNSGFFTTGVILAIICAIGYWASRRNTIIIASPSTKMKIKANRMEREKILDFIFKIELAINKRAMSLKNLQRDKV